MRVVSYYTKDSVYIPAASNLRKSLDAFHIPYDVVEYENLGDWYEATAFKSTFVHEMLLKYPHETIIFLDADCALKSEPTFFYDFKGSMAVHYRDGRELLSGCLVFGTKYRDATLRLVREWIKEQSRFPRVWDQKNLQNVIARSELRVDNLPAGYVKIFDKMAGVIPVIEHYQASRQAKKRETTVQDMPKTVRRALDGTYWTPRDNPEVTKFMDENFKRLGGELRWEHSPLYTSVSHLKNWHANAIINIVGKGPSLDKLVELVGPTIAINEAIHTVERICKDDTYVVQQDAKLQETCRPSKGTLLLARRCVNWYGDFRNKYVYNPIDFELKESALSVLVALHIAKLMGAKECHLYAFDACMTNDTRYADVIGYKSEKGGDPGRFLNHRPRIEQLARHLQLPIIFKAVDTLQSASCSTQLLLPHLQVPDGLLDSPRQAPYTVQPSSVEGMEGVQPGSQSSH